MDMPNDDDWRSTHPGYGRMFAPHRLTLGIFLPLRFFDGDMGVLEGQAELVAELDRANFAAVWVRDVPLYVPSFGDAGQLFDPFAYLAYLAARTHRIALATGSAIFTLRHPVDLAKSATTIDQLSGGRLVLGTASGDRPAEFPAYGIDPDSRSLRFAEAIRVFRLLTQGGGGAQPVESVLGTIGADAQLLPRPAAGRIPLIVTGASRQSLAWVAEHADGWLTYPGNSTATPAASLQLKAKIAAWRSLIPGQRFKPHMTNEWIDLVDAPDFPRTPLRGGFVLQTGRNGLLQLLQEWHAAGVNHAALGIQFARRPAREVLQELAEDVLPHFPTLDGPAPRPARW